MIQEDYKRIGNVYCETLGEYNTNQLGRVINLQNAIIAKQQHIIEELKGGEE
jgi:hypothetical protein